MYIVAAREESKVEDWKRPQNAQVYVLLSSGVYGLLPIFAESSPHYLFI